MITFYISLSILVSFLCSLLEAVILSVTPSYLSSLKQSNPKLYEQARYLKEDIEKPLASILTFNTIAHTIGAAGAGAEAQKLWGNEFLAIFSAILTFGILFFSEIIPKSIGAKSWKKLLPISAKILKPMILISLPIVWMSERISNFIKGDQISSITREEVEAIAEIGFSDGIIHKRELQNLKALIKFEKLQLTDILKSSDKIAGLFLNQNLEEAIDEIRTNTYSRLIAFGVNRDDIKGYIMRKDLLQAYISKEEIDLKEITKKILILPHTTSGQELLERLLESKSHISVVIDDNGSFLGIVTLEDLIERLLGLQIEDEFDQEG